MHPRILAASFALLVAACGSSEPVPDSQPLGQDTQPAAIEPVSACPIEGSEEVPIELPTSTGEALMVDGLDHDRLWNNDLNGDGMPDMILQQRGGCNSADECTVTVWLGCTPQTFTRVWGPDLAYELYVLEETHEHAGETWVTLERAMSDGDRGMTRTLLYFDGTSYGPAE